MQNLQKNRKCVIMSLSMICVFSRFDLCVLIYPTERKIVMKNHRKALILSMALMLLITAFSGCQSQQPETSEKTEPTTAAILPASTGDEPVKGISNLGISPEELGIAPNIRQPRGRLPAGAAAARRYDRSRTHRQGRFYPAFLPGASAQGGDEFHQHGKGRQV